MFLHTVKMKARILTSALAVVLFFSLAACTGGDSNLPESGGNDNSPAAVFDANEDKSWLAVADARTIKQFNDFLAENPNSPHADEARNRIAELAASDGPFEAFLAGTWIPVGGEAVPAGGLYEDAADHFLRDFPGHKDEAKVKEMITGRDIFELIDEGSVSVSVTGHSIKLTSLAITNNTELLCAVILPLGTWFSNGGGDVQNMVLTEEVKVFLPSNETVIEYAPTACMNMHKDIPGESDGFSIQRAFAFDEKDKILMNFTDMSVEEIDEIMLIFSDLFTNMSFEEFDEILKNFSDLSTDTSFEFFDQKVSFFSAVYPDMPFEEIAGIMLIFSDMFPDMSVDEITAIIWHFRDMFFDMYLIDLIRVLNENECEYPVIQAAVWMITDAATDSMLKSTLRTSNYGIGASVINDEHIAEAERMLALAGISRG